MLFYKIRGTELDQETRKEVDEADVLTHAVQDDDEVRVHLFLFIISVGLYALSALTVHDDFMIEILDDLRLVEFGWGPAYCPYSKSEEDYTLVLIVPMVLHSLVLLWWTAKFCVTDIENMCRFAPQWFIFIGVIV